jgi:hypothetical protein
MYSFDAAGTLAQFGLPDPRAPALDQNHQNDNKQHSGNNLNDRAIRHIGPSFPQ